MPQVPQALHPKVSPVLASGARSVFTAAALGAVHALSFAPGPLPAGALSFVQIFALAALFVLLQNQASARRVAGAAFAFGLANYSLGLYWLFISMHLYGGLATPLAALGVLVLAAFLSLFLVAAACLGHGLSVRMKVGAPGFWHSRLCTMALWATAWTAFEWLRGVLLTGFPWMSVGYAHLDSVLASWAPVVGVYGVAWLATFAAAAIAALIHDKDRSNDARSAMGVGIALLIGLSGIALSHIRWTLPEGEPLIVRLVQGNIEQSQKFDPQHLESGIARYLELAALPPRAENGVPDVIILPETVIPLFQDRIAPEVWEAWLQVATKTKATIILGAPLHDADQGRYTNSAIAFTAHTPLSDLIQGQVEMRYDKQHLVPFGEFIPTGFRWFVDAMTIPLGDFDRGSIRQGLFNIKGQQFSPDICYEDVFGEEIIQTVRSSVTHGPGANVLVNMSNLAWFGDSWALRQHLQISRMRALETGRPMLRATNTGMTAAIAPNGHPRAVLQPMQAGVLDVEVQGMTGTTPYVRWGNHIVLAWMALMFVWASTQRHRHARPSSLA